SSVSAMVHSSIWDVCTLRSGTCAAEPEIASVCAHPMTERTAVPVIRPDADAPRRPGRGGIVEWRAAMDYDEYEPDDLDFEDLFTEEAHFRTCGKCGTRTSPRWSESACLEEA